MTEEIKKYFWAVTLDKNKKKDVWDPDRLIVGPQGDTLKGAHRLSVKQIFLGAEIQDTDLNIVEVETRGFREQVIKFPIIITKERSIQVPLNFPSPPVEFYLVRGAGPLHLLGSHSILTDETDVDVVGMTAGDSDPVMELVVIDEGESDEQEKENRKDIKRCFSQSNITKIRKKVKGD